MFSRTFIITTLTVFALLAVLASCKRKDCVCGGNELFEDTFYFRFDTTTSGFSSAELGQNYILRYTKGDTMTPKDTFQKKTTDPSFAIGVNEKGFENYDYKVAGTGTYPYKFWITDIQIAGSENDCKCYTNNLKKCKVNGTLIDRTGNNDDIVLKK